MKGLKVVISKGAVFDETLSILDRAGFDISVLKKETRKLKVVSADGIEYIFSRPFDTPTFVEQGAADLGIVGKDILMETGKKVFELLDLNYGFCRFVRAAPAGSEEERAESYRYLGQIRVATKYVKVTEAYFNERGIQAEIIKLHGSVELAPLTGLAQEIIDLVSTGRTLQENDLVVIDEVAPSSVRLIANQVSYRSDYERVNEFVIRLKEAVI